MTTKGCLQVSISIVERWAENLISALCCFNRPALIGDLDLLTSK